MGNSLLITVTIAVLLLFLSGHAQHKSGCVGVYPETGSSDVQVIIQYSSSSVATNRIWVVSPLLLHRLFGIIIYIYYYHWHSTFASRLHSVPVLLSERAAVHKGKPGEFNVIMTTPQLVLYYPRIVGAQDEREQLVLMKAPIN